MKSKNINRFKEVAFLAAFLILLFSFSNRALSKIQNSEKKAELNSSPCKTVTVARVQ